jgi:predicted GIY-YIG superfamily endonuclease
MTGPRTIPTEQLLQQTDAPTKPGVYILKLDSPGPSLHAHARRWWGEYQTVHPDGVGGLAGAERLLYVGATNNLQERLEEHVQGEYRTSAWLDVYPPTELAAAIPQSAASRAFEIETQIAHHEARRSPETTAVICNGAVVG